MVKVKSALLGDVGVGGDPTKDASVHRALPRNGIGGRQADVRGLLQKGDLQMELLGDALGRRVAVTRPHDIFDI